MAEGRVSEGFKRHDKTQHRCKLEQHLYPFNLLEILAFGFAAATPALNLKQLQAPF